jgi:hypothetical protein
MFEQGCSFVSLPLLMVVVFCLALIFCSFGLLALHNATVVATLCLCALSVSAAIFLLVEVYSPFGGVVRISIAPRRNALAHVGK